MALDLLLAGYDSGHANRRMGAGPAALRAIALDALECAAPIEVRDCHLREAWRAELASGFELQRVVTRHATLAFARGHAPVLLAGNCNTMLGVIAAAQAVRDSLSVVWFDAHGDANLPELDSTGFLDGHGLSMLTGHAWQAATATLRGFSPLPGDRVVHVGGRDFNPGERERLREWGVTLVGPQELESHRWEETLDRGDPVHVHIDLDVLDADTVGPANSYAVVGGPSTGEVADTLAALCAHANLTSVSLASYDPGADTSGVVADAAHQVLRTLARGFGS